eukprot:9160156-Pyramimonas_sp.AAC.1
MCTISVTDSEGITHEVNVQTAPYTRSKLVIELSESNMQLLSKDPRSLVEGVKPFVPHVPQKHVVWLAYRQALGVRYYSSEKSRWVLKSEKIDGVDVQALQRIANLVAEKLEHFYEENHSEPPEGFDPTRI